MMVLSEDLRERWEFRNISIASLVSIGKCSQKTGSIGATVRREGERACEFSIWVENHSNILLNEEENSGA